MFTNTLKLSPELQFPDKKAIIFDDCSENVAELTFKQLKDTIEDVCNTLRKAKIQKGDRVLFVSSNHLYWLPIFLGISGYGAIAIPVDSNIAIERFQAIVKDAEPAGIIISKAIEERFSEFDLKDRIVYKVIDLNFDLFAFHNSEEIQEEAFEITPEDIAAIIYTSGTTGDPKGIMLSHRAFVSSINHGREISMYSTDDIMLGLLPFTHVFALVDSGLVQLAQNSTIVLSKVLNPADIMKLIMKYSITYITAVPRLADLLAFGIMQAKLELPPIKLVIGGASCRPKIIQLLKSAGLIPMQGYGMTETAAGILMCVDGPIESVGKAVGDIKVKIAGSGSGEGELMISSPTLLSGVWGKPELSEQLFVDGYFKTGDLANIDDNGFVYIKGRAKEVIISGTGINVYPDELEMRLGILPFSEEFAVFGMKDGDVEYPALVFLVKNEFFKDKNIAKAEEFATEEIRKMSEKWPDAEKIRKIFMVDKPLPRAINGKVKRFQLPAFLGLVKDSEDSVKIEKSEISSGESEKLFDIFKKEAAGFLNCKPEEITPETRFDNFVQLDSLGIIAMLVNLEKRFKVSFGELVGTPLENFGQLVDFLYSNMTDEKLELIKNGSVVDTDKNMPPLLDFSLEAIEQRINFLREKSGHDDIDFPIPEKPTDYSGNIEGFAGFSRLPLGIAGPLKVNGTFAKGEFYIPLATTEGALVSSVARGCQTITQSGGAEVRIICDSVVRTPIFLFKSISSMFSFGQWIEKHYEDIKKISETTTRHGKLEGIEQFPIGSKMILRFSFSTGDASGQNMTTIATRKAVDFILKNYSGDVSDWFLESNLSGDKKINGLNFTRNRGKKIIAQVQIPEEVIKNSLHTTPARMRQLSELAMVTSLQAHSFGVQAHFANVMAAMYIAAGQDPACVAESAAGITYLEVVDNDILISATLPGIMVGTVGGGTRLPTQMSCLKIMGCSGSGHSSKFAEILAATVLAGEISLIGAMAADEFTDAHAKYGRSGGLKI